MDTLKIFLHDFLPNIGYILPVITVIFFTSSVGFLLARLFLKPQNWLLILPISVLAGIFSFILWLGTWSYFLKGTIGIQIQIVLFVALGYILFVFQKKELLKEKVRLSWKSLYTLLIFGAFLLFIVFIGGRNTYGGDVIAYWGFATSFANGNYPMMSPWQPDLLAAHHQGGYLYEGALYALTSVSISLIHTIFSAVVITGGFFLLWGYARKVSGWMLISLLPAIIFYIAFSLIIIPLPKAVESILPYEVKHPSPILPILTDTKNRLGGSANLNEIYYINHRPTAFAGMFLIIILLLIEWRVSDGKKLIILSLLSVPIISTDEVVLPAIFLAIFYWWIGKLKVKDPMSRKKLLRDSFLSAIVFVIFFFVIGSALRDSLLMPAKEAPRFQLITDSNFLQARFTELKGAVLEYKNLPIILYMPTVPGYFLLALLAAIRSKSKISLMFIFGSIGILAAFLTAEHTYYPQNQGRFLHLIYLLLGSSIGFSILELIKRKLKWDVVLGFILFMLFLPGIISSSLYLVKQMKGDNYPNFKGTLPEYKVLSWSKKNIPNKRILFLDGYLFDQSYSYLTLNGIQQYGLIVPVSPAHIKVHTPDFGVEAMDVLYSLDPKSMEELKLEYFYLVEKQRQNLPKGRLNNLNNPIYFDKVYSDDLGTMYKIKQNYIQNAQAMHPTLLDINSLIPKNSKIYLDNPPQMDFGLRAVLMLMLKDLGTVYTHWGPGGFNYIETKITYSEPVNECVYDYLVLSKKTDPTSLCPNENLRKIFDLSDITIYQKNETK